MSGRLTATLLLVAALLPGCAATDRPVSWDVPPGPDPATAVLSTPECALAYPEEAGTGSLWDAHGILPSAWPAPPRGAVLCAVLVDGSRAVLLYAAPDSSADEVLDHYERALTPLGWSIVRDDGIDGEPILTVAAPGLDIGIRTDTESETYVADFEVLAP